jgi:hypothetical protein
MIAVFDGQIVDPFTVTHADGVFRIETIAHALARTCRYGGHTSRFYSVAEHCLLVERVVRARSAHATRMSPAARVQAWRDALVHDAAEAYLHDVPAPLKKQPAFAAYVALEERLTSELRLWFCLPAHQSGLVQQVDVEIRATEMAQLMPYVELREKVEPIQSIICGTMSVDEAQSAWLQRFHELFPVWRDNRVVAA